MRQRSFIAFAIDRLPRGEKGFLLVAALTLLSALTLLGTTAYLLSATDIKIGGNFRNNQIALQVAMAGAERARRGTGKGAAERKAASREVDVVAASRPSLAYPPRTARREATQRHCAALS